MRHVVGRPVILTLVAGTLLAGPLCGPVLAQVRPNAQGRGAAQPGVTPRELQELFDAMVLMRAQEALKLSDDQYPQFLTRLKALQEVRRQAQIERLRMLNEVRRMLNTEDAELDGSLRDRLTELANLDVTTAERTRQALERLDEVLDLRQQAMFRVFEERMEQQKLDLLTRARQGNRQNRF